MHECLNICIISFSPDFPTFRLNLERSPYSVQMRENAGKTRTRATPNTDSLVKKTNCQNTAVFQRFLSFCLILHDDYEAGNYKLTQTTP